MITKQQYVEYLICTIGNYTSSHLAEHLEDVSHDVITDYLRSEHLTARGIGIVNLVQSAGDKQDFYPIDYRIYAPDQDGKTKNEHFSEMVINAQAEGGPFQSAVIQGGCHRGRHTCTSVRCKC